MGYKPEILAPAGQIKSVYGAFNAGADAVYLGAPSFSARAFAKNLTIEEIKYKWSNDKKIPCIFISALKKDGIEKLRDDIYKMVAEIHAGRYPFNNFLW